MKADYYIQLSGQYPGILMKMKSPVILSLAKNLPKQCFGFFTSLRFIQNDNARHSRAGGNPGKLTLWNRTPAFAGVTER